MSRDSISLHLYISDHIGVSSAGQGATVGGIVACVYVWLHQFWSLLRTRKRTVECRRPTLSTLILNEVRTLKSTVECRQPPYLRARVPAPAPTRPSGRADLALAPAGAACRLVASVAVRDAAAALLPGPSEAERGGGGAGLGEGGRGGLLGGLVLRVGLRLHLSRGSSRSTVSLIVGQQQQQQQP